jgi:predicted dehydrogenase
MSKVRMAVIGVGWWGTYGHLAPLSEDPLAEVVAVYSRTLAKARQQAEHYGVPRYYDDVDQLLDECELDAVVVATTPNVHYEQARKALERGLHALVEKPFTLSAEHARDLARIAEERNLLLSVAHPYLFSGTLGRAREIIRERLGPIVAVNAVFGQRVIDLYRGDTSWLQDRREGTPGFQPPNSASYSDPAIVGGGEGHTQASHLVGSVLWLTGLCPREVFAYMDNADTRVDVVDAVTVRFQGSAVGTWMANGYMPPRTHTYDLSIYGQDGIVRISWDNAGGRAALLTSDGPETIEENPSAPAAEVPRNFVRAILGQEELRVPARIAVDEVAILDAAYRSAEQGIAVATDEI